MTDRLPAGAALPKDTRAVRPSIRGQVKGVCVTFPACDGSGYFTAAQWRAGKIPSCYCGAGQLIPANPEACLELCPDRVHEHPDAAAMSALAHQGAEAWTGEACASCGHHRAPHLHPDLWYCRKCYGVNERQPDGTLGWFKAGPFSPEAEKCNGMAADRACRSRCSGLAASSEAERPEHLEPRGAAVTIPRRGDAPERIRAGMVECVPAPGGDAIPF